MDSLDQSDEHYDDTLRDDASIEVLSEGGESCARELEWSIYSAGRSISGSSMSLMDFQKLSIYSKMATIVHHDGQQFIERMSSGDGDGLPYSAEFRLGDEMWKLSGEERLLTSGSRYVARVCVEGTVDLDNAVDFEEALGLLLRHLKVDKVFVDELLEEYNKAKGDVKMLLLKLVDGSEKGNDHARELLQLRRVLGEHDSILNPNVNLSLENCSDISSETVSAINCFATKALKLFPRNEILDRTNTSQLPSEFIDSAIQEAVSARKAQLATICPLVMKDKFMELDDKNILYISKADMDLFTDLSTLDQAMFEPALAKLISKFLARLQRMNDDHTAPLSNRILFFVCKSLQETANELGVHIVYSEEDGWDLKEVPEEAQSSHGKCLWQQLRMLAKLANHFEPGGPFQENRFPYEFKHFQNMDSIPEEVRIWLCLVDDSIEDPVKADLDKMETFSCLFKSYVSFIGTEGFRNETLEGLRVITHDALRSLAEMRRSSLQEQVNVGSNLPEYNEMISNCFRSSSVECFKNDSEQIQATLRRIISQARTKNAPSDELSALSKVFENLLTDISDLQFEWFIQLPPSDERDLLMRGQFINAIDNQWKGTDHQCFQVVDQKGFVKVYRALHDGDEIPRNYQLKVIRELLQYVDTLATKQAWQGGKRLSEGDQLEAMTALICSIRKTILYLREQLDYACFQEFQQKTVKPFANVVEASRSLQDFRNRVALIRNLRTRTVPDLDATDFEEALKFILPHTSLSRTPKKVLQEAFNRYSAQYEQLILENNTLTRETRIQRISLCVMIKIKPLLAPDWTSEFKKNTLPEILAELSAVWSLIVSKDVSSLESLLKPTCLQICYIFHFLLMETPVKHTENHLLKISTKQGKTLVQGLIAAFLALFGHDVVIVCYNSSLFRRNAADLLKLFDEFSVQSKISYGTIEDLARKQSELNYYKYAKYVHKCLGVPFNHKSVSPSENSLELAKTVLLIDEIDIILLEKTLGKSFVRFVSLTIPGLGKIQEKIYGTNQELSRQEIEEFIDKSDLPEMAELKAFLSRPYSYNLMEGYYLNNTECTNKTLFLSHVSTMLRNKNIPPNCRLTSDGTLKTTHLINGDILRYKTTAAYFQLKQSNFQQIVDGHKNYGSLLVCRLPFPYEGLLNKFSLVLGFGNTPQLSDRYENQLLKDHYNMTWRLMLCSLDHCPTKFDSAKDFLCVASEQNWRISIMTAIKVAIERHDTVLVFFKNDDELHRFQREFSSQLKRLSVSTIETTSNGKYHRAGESLVDEITILIIEDVSDPEERDIHVIQTFCSLDAREEVLIRKQSEQKHGNGSYELILCIPQVNKIFLNAVTVGSYNLLVDMRNSFNMEHIKLSVGDKDKYEKLLEKCSTL